MCNSDDVSYTYEKFLSHRPMGVIEVTKHIRNADDNDTSKKIVFDFEQDVANNTLCYIIMLGIKTYDYDIKNQHIVDHI